MGSWTDKNKGLVRSSWSWLGTEQPELLHQWCYTSPLHRRFCGDTFIESQFWRFRVTQRIFYGFQKKRSSSFFLLHQTSIKESKLWEPSKFCTEQDTQSLREALQCKIQSCCLLLCGLYFHGQMPEEDSLIRQITFVQMETNIWFYSSHLHLKNAICPLKGILMSN